MLYICNMPSGNLPLSQPHPTLTVPALKSWGYGQRGRHARCTLLRHMKGTNMNTVTINNLDVLKTVTCNHMIEGFKSYTKNWPTKFAGPVPTAEMFMVSLLFGKNRKPGPEAGFIAMQLRPEGASVAELSMAFNCGPAHNHSRALSHDTKGNGLHLFTRTKGNGKFWLTFTAKGVKALESALKGMAVQMAAGEATNVTDKPKAKKATKGPVGKKSTSKPRKPKGGHVPLEAELNASTLAAVEAELAERNAQLDSGHEVIKPIDQQNA